ncbi:hypothetical protein M595_4580 [Lyngbya aestuarii BL J]|uniref:Uncharacterized protein n=1 Tax=Lyngbya aestuarii BL J TaxID=1348334 RepID=U7QEI2_9CYAN|nr:hypothetical protein [Lyngbya aestuarii]ERT05455.1 hypothetical protein M595_4580 [Lyngbya aestuarii BL J]
MKIAQGIFWGVVMGVNFFSLIPRGIAEEVQRLDAYQQPSVSASDLEGKGLDMGIKPSSASFPQGGPSLDKPFAYEPEYLNQAVPTAEVMIDSNSQNQQGITLPLTPSFNSQGVGVRGIPIPIGN